VVIALVSVSCSQNTSQRDFQEGRSHSNRIY
jgi:hypothetical protein